MAKVATITIDHTKVAADLTDFPVTIICDSDAGWAELYNVATANGGDIRLFKAGGVDELPREIVSFSVSAETGEIHAKYSGTLSSTVDTIIEVHADGTSSDYAVTDTYGRNAVWADYIGVFHQQMSSGDAVDSTGNDDLAVVGSPTYSATGKIGDATDHPGTTNNKFSQTTSVLGTTVEPITLQAWIKPDVTSGARSIAYMGDSSGEHGILQNGTAVWALSQDGTFPSSRITGALAANTWSMVHGVFASDSSRTVYHNGTAGTENTVSISVSAGSGMAIDDRLITNQPFDGALDEIRYRGSALSADWITTEYNNQNSPATFYSVTAETGGGPTNVAARRALAFGL